MKVKSYISDPKWNSSFIGRFIWLYRGSGFLEWTGNLLIYSDKIERKIQIEKDKIVEIHLSKYHRTAKPITLNFIDIKYKNNDSEEKRLFFTPTLPDKNPWFTTVWTTNRYVKECMEKINNWKNSVEV